MVNQGFPDSNLTSAMNSGGLRQAAVSQPESSLCIMEIIELLLRRTSR